MIIEEMVVGILGGSGVSRILSMCTIVRDQSGVMDVSPKWVEGGGPRERAV